MSLKESFTNSLTDNDKAALRHILINIKAKLLSKEAQFRFTKHDNIPDLLLKVLNALHPLYTLDKEGDYVMNLDQYNRMLSILDLKKLYGERFPPEFKHLSLGYIRNDEREIGENIGYSEIKYHHMKGQMTVLPFRGEQHTLPVSARRPHGPSQDLTTYNKYLKYKMKYLELKNKNIF